MRDFGHPRCPSGRRFPHAFSAACAVYPQTGGAAPPARRPCSPAGRCPALRTACARGRLLALCALRLLRDGSAWLVRLGP